MITTELDKIAYDLYENYMWSKFYLMYDDIDRFVKLKDDHTDYYDDAKIILRKRKLEKIKIKTIYENFKKK